MKNPTTLTAARFRANVYRVLDQILETGVPVEIERHGCRLRILPVSAARARAGSKLAALKSRRYLRCRPDKLIQIDWSREWRP